MSLLFTLRFLLLVFIILLLAAVKYVRTQENYDNKYLNYSSELRVLTQRIGKRTGEISALGLDASFSELAAQRQKFDEILNILVNGEYTNNTLSLVPSPGKIQQTTLAILTKNWIETKRLIDYILDNKEAVISANQLNIQLQSRIRKITSEYWEVLNIISRSNVDGEKMLQVAHQIENMSILQDYIEKILALNLLSPQMEKDFPLKVNEYVNYAEGIRRNITDPNAKVILDKIYIEMITIQQYLEEIIQTGKTLDEVYTAIEKILTSNIIFLNDATSLYQSYAKEAETRLISHTAVNIIGALALLTLFLLGYLLYRERKLELVAIEEKNRKIQHDVEVLVQELSDLANGNLGIKVSVNSGVTKEIAVSINYAIEALRKLVTHINGTTQKATNMTLEAKKLTTDLAQASEKQAKEISKAAEKVQDMAKIAEQVFIQANSSATVAEQSVNIANTGTEVVRNTINGMERIQTQIQATSNKVRRLSDSSNEIGQIISLIDSIADQTNILSLNASIQAAMAGEAGLGFAVVADEVQRLAEKAGFATREIEALVKSIQVDTQEVITAMEQTRAEVKEGGSLAFNAGKALEKIELVSKSLANHIQSIAASATEQKNMSVIIAEMMTLVKDFAEQIASGSVNTAEFSAKLTKLVLNLSNSVFEFKLPTNGNQNTNSSTV